jgi:C-terminal peptidase prc
MTKAKFAGLLALLVWAALAVQVRASEENSSSHTYVILVGISNYADKQIKARPHAEEDAQALYDLFTDKDFLGVEKNHVRLLLGSPDEKRGSQPATKDNILKALQWVGKEAKGDDLVLFAFIGQGGTLNDKGDRLGYFASDSTVQERNKTAVDAAEITEELDKLKTQHFCAFVDVNFKGYTVAQGTAAEPKFADTPFREFVGDDGTEDHAYLPGRALFLATNGLTGSLDLADHGLFTKVLIDGLKGEADKEGYEPDGLVTVDELATYVNKEIHENAVKSGKTKEEKLQRNFVLGGRDSHYVLTRNPAAFAKANERLSKFEKLVKDNTKITPKLADEGRTLLSRMPKLESQRSLRKEYQQMIDGTITVDKFLTERDGILESAKLPRADAETFADKVFDGARMITKDYYKPMKPGELIGWAIRGLYRRVDEKIPDNLKARLDKAKDMEESELKGLLADARQGLGAREDLDKHKDVDFALQTMLRHLDPYTTYIDAETLARFQTEMRGQFFGVGISITKDLSTDYLQVISPIYNSPAHKAGVQAGDFITTITRDVDENGKPLDPPEVLSTKGMSTNDAVKKITGKPDTKVKLTLEREGASQPIQVELTRSLIEVETVMGYHRKDDGAWDFWLDPDSKIGYVRLTQFTDNTFRDMAKAVIVLKKQGMKGLVLDLRFDPGGLLDIACQVADLFIDDGLIVTVKHRSGSPEVHLGHHENSLLDFPMVCLVNGHSASASEIVSSCLQDHNRAIILGERTYGKGLVQDVRRFEGGQLKMTTATYWRPSGKNINKSSTSGKDDEEWGVMPDPGFLLALSSKEESDLEDHLKNQEIIRAPDRAAKEPKSDFKDRQLELALEYLRGQIKVAEKATPKKAG